VVRARDEECLAVRVEVAEPPRNSAPCHHHLLPCYLPSPRTDAAHRADERPQQRVALDARDAIGDHFRPFGRHHRPGDAESSRRQVQSGKKARELDLDLRLERFLGRGFEPDGAGKALALEWRTSEPCGEELCQRRCGRAVAGELCDQLLELAAVDVIRVGGIEDVPMGVQEGALQRRIRADEGDVPAGNLDPAGATRCRRRADVGVDEPRGGRAANLVRDDLNSFRRHRPGDGQVGR
jgi:hypothetical protein